MNTAREIDLVNTFVVPQKRARYAGFVSSPKTRPKFLRALDYFSDFVPARVVQLSGETRTAEGLLAELRCRGAPEECYVISVYDEVDGTTRPLAETVRDVYGSLLEGTIICCVPRQLAYYEGERPHNRFILDSRGRR